MSSRPLPPSLPTAARAAMARWARAWGLPDLAERVTFEWSTRLRRSAGRSLPERGVVRLADWLDRAGRASQRVLLKVLCHELAHIAVYERHGRRVRPHGAEWAALVRAAGFAPTVRLAECHIQSIALPTTAPRSPASRATYRHYCPICQMERRARRPVPRWRCRACSEAGLDGRLTIERAGVPVSRPA